MQPIAIPAKERCFCFCLFIFYRSAISFIGVLAKKELFKQLLLRSLVAEVKLSISKATIDVHV